MNVVCVFVRVAGGMHSTADAAHRLKATKGAFGVVWHAACCICAAIRITNIFYISVFVCLSGFLLPVHMMQVNAYVQVFSHSPAFAIRA